jgi:hypothetical protein
MREPWQNWEGLHVLGGDYAAQLGGKGKELGELRLVVGLLESSDQVDLVAAASRKFDAACFEEAFEFSDLAVLVIKEAALLEVIAGDVLAEGPGGVARLTDDRVDSLAMAASDRPVRVVRLSFLWARKPAHELDYALEFVRALGFDRLPGFDHALGLGRGLDFAPDLATGHRVRWCGRCVGCGCEDRVGCENYDLDKIDELRAVGWWEVVEGAREWPIIPGNL